MTSKTIPMSELVIWDTYECTIGDVTVELMWTGGLLLDMKSGARYSHPDSAKVAAPIASLGREST